MAKKTKIKSLETTVETLLKGEKRIINSIEVVGVDGEKIVRCINTKIQYKLIKPKK